MEQFGLCQEYRQAVEDGRIKVEENCRKAFSTHGLEPARETCLSCLPAAQSATDLIAQNPDNLKMLDDPFVVTRF